MTATPIPRTLGQVLYADLDVSDLRTPPAGRDPDPDRDPATGRPRRHVAKVREEAALGHRTFVVVPLIEERGVDDGDGRGRAPRARRSGCAALLDPLRVGLVHGRLKAAERDAEMTRFRDGELDVLVGTTVVEVGVDVPAATMMVIEGADRFGLAQLHQLRGRVGRGTVESFCVLVTDSTDEVGAWPGSRRSSSRTTGSSSPRRTSSCAARATSWASPRAGCPRLRVASLQVADASRARRPRPRATPRRCSTRDGRMRRAAPGARPRARGGWLRRVAAGEPASGA